MKRLVIAVVCCAVLLANAGGAVADSAADHDGQSYLQAARGSEIRNSISVRSIRPASACRVRTRKRYAGFRAPPTRSCPCHLILGGLYAIGRGAQKDNINAYKWAYIVDTASRVEEFRNGARQLMGLLETRTTADEVNRAKSDGSRWRAAPAAGPGANPGARQG